MRTATVLIPIPVPEKREMLSAILSDPSAVPYGPPEPEGCPACVAANQPQPKTDGDLFQDPEGMPTLLTRMSRRGR